MQRITHRIPWATFICLSLFLTPGCSFTQEKEDGFSVKSLATQAPIDGKTIWRLNETNHLILKDSMSESDIAQICHVQNGKIVNRWKTGGRSYCSPVVLTSYPDQYILIPYKNGGGTSVAEYGWCLVYLSGDTSGCYEMGCYTYWSVSREKFVFSLSPNLLRRGKSLTFDFLYSHESDQKNRIVRGCLQLHIQNKQKALLVPVSKWDAEALIVLLESPLDASRHWAREVILPCLPETFGQTIIQKKWEITLADRKKILHALMTCPPRFKPEEAK